MTPEWYALVKSLHLATVTLSFTGFMVRAWWRATAPERLGRAWVRRLPHVNDSVLLASGLTLAVQGHVSPFAQPWLGAKLMALLGYIACGSLALRGRTEGVRRAALIAAVGTIGYIVAVALTRQPAPWA
ncbi:MAG: SirB2 family protein [Thiohalomonadaceae bacterium]